MSVSYQNEILLNALREIYRDALGRDFDSVTGLKADSSDRKIFRLKSGEESHIAVYNNHPEENLAYIGFSASFSNGALKVPRVLAVSHDNYAYLVEDLGDVSLYKLLKHLADDRESCMDFCKKALSDLIQFQNIGSIQVDFDLCYAERELAGKVVNGDVDKFTEYYLKKLNNIELPQAFAEDVKDSFNTIVERNSEGLFMYRDFQPRNIMVFREQLWYIDFQSGMKGPSLYDLASFLYSGSIELSDDERIVLKDFYAKEFCRTRQLNPNEFMNDFAEISLLRMIQVLGSYALVFKRKGNEEILGKIPNALVNIRKLESELRNDCLKRLAKVVSDISAGNHS